MAQFNQLVLTTQGISLITKALAGDCKIKLTKVQAGDGDWTTSLVDATALKSMKQEFGISEIKVANDATVDVLAILNNLNLSEGYYVKEVGIFGAEEGHEDSTEILYGIVTAVADKADYMPPYNSISPQTMEIETLVTVANASEVTIKAGTGALAAADTVNQLSKDVGSVAALETSDKSSIVSAINSIQSIAAILTVGGSGLHNSILRGKSLGSAVTDAQWEAIKAGTFDDLWIGDYWTINNVIWRIAAFDYYYRAGDIACTDHHVTIVPDTSLNRYRMNATNTTDGGYAGSEMYTTNLAAAKTIITNAFGSGHILTHRNHLHNAVSNGKASGGTWYDSAVELMTEANVYGNAQFRPVSDGSTIPNNYDVDNAQYPLFRLDHQRIIEANRDWYWLRDIISAACFARVTGFGDSSYDYASNVYVVRPAFSIKAA